VSDPYDVGGAEADVGYESAAAADSPGGGYHETEAQIASLDQLPTPQESVAATWGDDPDYYDEADSASEYDGDLSAIIAQQDELPTPQESHAATWGDDPDYYDEADLASEYDGDLKALMAEDHGRESAEDPATGTPPGEAGTRQSSGDDAAGEPSQGGADSAARPQITHYQASVRGEQLDLWTDGRGHWAGDYKRADDALPVDHLADVRSRMGTEVTPATAYVDGHEIEVTRDPGDGVWILGLPGEVPDEAGDILAGAETSEEKQSRSRDFASELVRNTENLYDEVKEVSDDTYKGMHHPPEGKAEVPVPVHGPVLESTAHEPELGDAVTGIFTLAIGMWVLGRKFHELVTRGKARAGHAGD
jgi:hypothetical protein